MATSGESFTLASNAAAGNGAAVSLLGGDYLLTYEGTLAGTSNLQTQDANGVWVPVGSALGTANGSQNVSVPAGQYRVVLGTASSACYVYITRIPR